MSVSGMVQSFRRAKFGSAAVLAITSAVAAFPSAASAIELSEVTLQTDCRAAALDRISTGAKLVIGWDLKCAEKQVKLADQENRASIERAKAADVFAECVGKLRKFSVADPDGFRALGKITRETACAAANRIPTPVANRAKPSAG